MQMIPMTTDNNSHVAVTVCGSIAGLLTLRLPGLAKYRLRL